jgi:hypothetical protein
MLMSCWSTSSGSFNSAISCCLMPVFLRYLASLMCIQQLMMVAAFGVSLSLSNTIVQVRHLSAGTEISSRARAKKNARSRKIGLGQRFT